MNSEQYSYAHYSICFVCVCVCVCVRHFCFASLQAHIVSDSDIPAIRLLLFV